MKLNLDIATKMQIVNELVGICSFLNYSSRANSQSLLNHGQENTLVGCMETSAVPFNLAKTMDGQFMTMQRYSTSVIMVFVEVYVSTS